MHGIQTKDDVRVYDPGEDDCRVEVHLPILLLAEMGISEGEALLVEVRDDEPGHIYILGPALTRETRGPLTFRIFPEPDQHPWYAARFFGQFPRAWKDQHRRRHEATTDDPDLSYEPIDVLYDLVEAESFLKPGGTLVIPL